MRVLVVAFLLCLGGAHERPAQLPAFTILRSETTKQHVAIQPKDEHHRVYFPLRIENCAGKMAFARIRSKVDKSDQETTSSVQFPVRGNNELWRVHLRAPRYDAPASVYQIEVGVVDWAQLDVEVVRGSAAWQVRRDGPAVSFLTELPNPGGDPLPVSIPLISRTATVEGGEVRIQAVVYHAAIIPGTPLKVGLDQSGQGAQTIHGSGAVQVKE